MVAGRLGVLTILIIIIQLGWLLTYLAGVVVAIVLLARRRSAGRVVLLVGFLVALATSVCGGLTDRDTIGPWRQFMVEQVDPRITTWAFLLSSCVGALAVAALVVGIWLLAHERPREIHEDE